MRLILAPRNRSLLQRFASAATLIALDFDGTLAPIVRTPNRAALRKSTRQLLAELATHYPCVIISGRARSDVRRRLDGVKVKQVIGNHGIEPWSTTPAMERAVRSWVPRLRGELQTLGGVVVENKRFSVAVHYRHEPRPQPARMAIMAAARRLGAVRIVGGKRVVNIMPAAAPHKGLALERALLKTHCDKAIYIGDDITDEDVFALSDRRRVLSIRVGESRSSLAPYYIPAQRDIDSLLRRLIELRSGA